MTGSGKILSFPFSSLLPAPFSEPVLSNSSKALGVLSDKIFSLTRSTTKTPGKMHFLNITYHPPSATVVVAI